MSEPTQTIEGWYAYHDFRQVNWPAWRRIDAHQRTSVLQEWQELSQQLRADDTARTSSYGAYAIAGHKADLLFLHFRKSLEELAQCKNRLNKTRLADFLQTSFSYVSIVELSSYLSQPGVVPEEDPRLLPRLRPALPNSGSICFYPMNKRRTGDDNWYMLPKDERAEMMASHGRIGRDYAGRVSQVITGSVGLDDWEWGVTLFADDPLQFKKLIYEMRFDEVSARYGDFGAFYVGHTATDDEVTRLLTV